MVLFGKAKLMADRIVLKGLFYEERIMLADIVEVRWAHDRLVIVTADETEFDMIIQAAALWKYELQARCGLQDSDDVSRSSGIPVMRPPGSDGQMDSESESLPEWSVRTTEDDDVPSQEPSTEESQEAVQQDMFAKGETEAEARSAWAEDRPGRSQHTS